ncbi:MAG: hypothetical protein V4709_00220 [Pseudomonadota bacterium]
MADYFDVHRRFRVIAEEERKQADWANRPELWSGGGHLGWPELLDHQRVLVLAEAGSGKTEEMRQQAKRLNERGKSAFFLPLEVLDRDSFGDALLMQEAAAFRSWLAEGQCPGWFFLDSVDELKLRQGSLERAFRGMARALADQQHRAHIFISCRPGDWLASDAHSLVRCLSLPVSLPTLLPIPAEEHFLVRLRSEKSNSRQDKPLQAAGSKSNAEPTIAVLSPLDADQIQRFAEQCGLVNSASFIAEIELQNAWGLANRPVDLLNLIGAWLQSGRLGSYAEQHETNVCRKLHERPGYPDHGAPGDEHLREGAERLALALTLTRTRSLHAPGALQNSTTDATALNPAVVLSDWQPSHREALLRRGGRAPQSTPGPVPAARALPGRMLASDLCWQA